MKDRCRAISLIGGTYSYRVRKNKCPKNSHRTESGGLNRKGLQDLGRQKWDKALECCIFKTIINILSINKIDLSQS